MYFIEFYQMSGTVKLQILGLYFVRATLSSLKVTSNKIIITKYKNIEGLKLSEALKNIWKNLDMSNVCTHTYTRVLLHISFGYVHQKWVGTLHTIKMHFWCNHIGYFIILSQFQRIQK